MSTAPLLTGLPALPLPRTSLIGREAAVAAVRALLQRDDVPLVTLLGPGGVGKTHLALEVARSGDAFPDGVAFVSLAPVRDPALVLPMIARALDVGNRGARPLPEHLASWLGERRLLLVVDNFEQVAAAAVELSDLLARCPGLTILATSRIALRIAGEHRFLVSPLPLPNLDRLPAADEVATIDAVALFLQRAQAEDPSFTLTMENAPVVAEICARLDGLPLAIELAVARLGVLSPEGLLARLSDRLRLLTGGDRDQPERLQTMRDAIAWSYHLLDPEEQPLFRRLSVFVGDFTLEAAEALAGDDGVDVVEGLAKLVDHSLVRRSEQTEGEPRFGLLETIREFGLDELGGTGEAAEVRARYFAYYLALAEQADRVPFASEKEGEVLRLEAEAPNIRAALDWAASQADAEPLLRLVVALWWYWDQIGLLKEGGVWVDRAVVATAQVPPRLRSHRARLLAAAAMGPMWLGSTAGADMLLDEALALARESGDDRAIIQVLVVLGHLAIDQGELDRAEAPLMEALARERAVGDPGRTVESLFRLGILNKLRGDRRASEVWFAECLAVARAAGWKLSIAYATEALGTAARDMGDNRKAAGLFAEALAFVKDRGDPSVLSNCLRSLGSVAALDGRAEQAARLFGASVALLERHGYGVAPLERAYRESLFAVARDALPVSTFAAAWAAGQELTREAAIDEAFEVAEAVTADDSVRAEAPAGLTPREVEVLRLLVDGHSDREIAEMLFVSRHTATNHVGRILGKLNVSSRAAAAAWAVRNGLA